MNRHHTFTQYVFEESNLPSRIETFQLISRVSGATTRILYPKILHASTLSLITVKERQAQEEEKLIHWSRVSSRSAIPCSKILETILRIAFLCGQICICPK